jgi:hypothetical protein
MVPQSSKPVPADTLPSTSPKTSVPIPSDILYLIVKYLSQHDLATLSRVTRELHLIATPILYGHLFVKVLAALSPVSIRRIPIDVSLSLGNVFRRHNTGYRDDNKIWCLARYGADWENMLKEKERVTVGGEGQSRSTDRPTTRVSKWFSKLKG